jgi:hypothetical protein
MGRDHFRDFVVYGMIILKWILKTQSGKVWTGIVMFPCGQDNEILGFIKGKD